MNEDVEKAKESLRFLLSYFALSYAKLLNDKALFVWRPVFTANKLDTLFTTVSERGFDMEIGDGIAGGVAATRKPVQVGPEGMKRSQHVPIVERYEWKHGDIWPVLHGDTLLGVGAIYSRNEFVLPLDTKETLEGFMLAGLLSIDIAVNSSVRDKSLDDALLSLEIGRAAEDRFHDIKETLFGAMGAVSAIKRQSKGIASVTKNIGIVEKQIIKARDYSDKYIREAKNPNQLDWEEFDLVDFVKAIVNDFQDRNRHRAVTRSRKIEIHYHLPPDSIRIRGDKERLYRAINNIVYNAEYWVVRTATDIARVDITLVNEGDGHAYLKIRDTGPGIIEKKRAVEKGYSLRGGTGLGLAIATKIVDLHGGKLELTSEPLLWTAVTMKVPHII